MIRSLFMHTLILAIYGTVFIVSGMAKQMEKMPSMYIPYIINMRVLTYHKTHWTNWEYTHRLKELSFKLAPDLI